ncbi:hypothetical protein [Luteolibacter soli]|uniref:Uncharacterized protein n=1 Tax=Luteolibacter soli TaxID=3135280 RepID=A0ABU9AQT5_9BACT
MKYLALMVLPVIACSALAEEDPFAGGEPNKAVVEKDDAFEVVADPAGKAYFPEGRASYYTKELLAMKEPSVLSPLEKGVDRVFRFTCLRSFHDPLVVRITEAGGIVTARAVQLHRDESYRPVGIVHDKTWELDEKSKKAIAEIVPTRKDFWMPLSDAEETLSGLDGSTWIFEVHDKEGYRMVDVWSPGVLSSMDMEEMKKMLDGRGLDLSKIRDFRVYKRTGEKLLEIGEILPKPEERY